MVRDRRRIGAGPYVLGLRRVEERWGTGFPFDLAAIRGIEALRIDAPVTLLAGDNGAGKSTVVEAVAEAMGFPEAGGELERFSDGPGSTVARPRPVLSGALEPVTGATKPSRGYFLRAESFFNVAGSIGDPDALLAPDLSIYGGTGLLEQSHGESFLASSCARSMRCPTSLKTCHGQEIEHATWASASTSYCPLAPLRSAPWAD